MVKRTRDQSFVDHSGFIMFLRIYSANRRKKTIRESFKTAWRNYNLIQQDK